MSRENVERLRAVYSAWAEGNFRVVEGLYAPDVTFETMSDGRQVLGRDEIEPYMRGFLAQWSDFRAEAEGFADFGETILVTERQRGMGRESGAPAESVFYVTWTFRDRLVTRVRWENDRAEALAAAGLAE